MVPAARHRRLVVESAGLHGLSGRRAHHPGTAGADERASASPVCIASGLGCGGDGFTVREVLEAARLVTGKDIPLTVGPRRAGDPAVLVASSNKIRQELGWQPHHESLEAMVGSAWSWMRAHPHGYGKES